MREMIIPMSYHVLILLGYGSILAMAEYFLLPGRPLFAVGMANVIIVHAIVCVGIAIYQFVKRRRMLGVANLLAALLTPLLGLTLIKDFGAYIS
jgi:hypothetical protein